MYTPEEVKVLLVYVGQGEQRGVVKPPSLDNHLHQITDAQSRHQPALIRHHVQHGLQEQDKNLLHTRLRGNNVMCKYFKHIKASYNGKNVEILYALVAYL